MWVLRQRLSAALLRIIGITTTRKARGNAAEENLSNARRWAKILSLAVPGQPMPRLVCFSLSARDRERVRSALREAERLIPAPPNLRVLAVGRRSGTFAKVSACIPPAGRGQFGKLWHGNSLAFYYRFQEPFLVVFYTRQNAYLRRNRNAFVGLLLHEMTHAVLDAQGVHRQLDRQFKAFVRRIDHLRHPRMETLYPVLADVGSIAKLALKELYMVAWLVQRGRGDYLLENYREVFPADRCPRPLFYRSRKSLQDPETFRLTFEFTLSMLAILLPLERLQSSAADEFLGHMEECYLVNLGEMIALFKPLRNLIRKRFSYGEGFQRAYFDAVFKAMLALIS